MSHSSKAFEEKVLNATLAAVRSQRRRKAQMRSLALLILAAAAAWFAWRPDVAEDDAVALIPRGPGIAPAPASIVRVMDSAEIATAGVLRIFHTADLAPAVDRIDDRELADLLAGRPYGTYLASDGTRRLWLAGF